MPWHSDDTAPSRADFGRGDGGEQGVGDLPRFLLETDDNSGVLDSIGCHPARSRARMANFCKVFKPAVLGNA